MSKIVIEVSRIGFAFVAVYSAYLLAHGHLTPGGGFQGGAVMASAMAMVMVAYGVYSMKEKLLSVSKFIGLFALLILIYFISHFFHSLVESISSVSFGPNTGQLISGGVIPLMNFAVGLEVMCGITLLIIIMRKGD